MITRFDPFSDDSSVILLDGLSVENGLSGIAIYGEIQLRKDSSSLHAIDLLVDVLTGIRREIEASVLEDTSQDCAVSVEEVSNPFA